MTFDRRAASTWGARELPILAAALRRLDAGEYFPSLEEIRAEVDLSADQMRAGLKALEGATPPYIEVAYTMAGAAVVGGHVVNVSERARRELGSWPSPEDFADRIVSALSEAAAVETSSERKSKLRATAETLGSMARDVMVQVAAAQLGRL